MPLRPSEFSRRVVLYRRLDAASAGCTGFFAAAAEINSTLARLFRFPSALASQQSFQFLGEVGAILEQANIRFARELDSRRAGVLLDLELVRAEQALLQQEVCRVKCQQPRSWKTIRTELNALLNGRHGANWLLQRCGACNALARSLAIVRSRLGSIDFALEGHRVQVGLALIRSLTHIERVQDPPRV